MINRLQSLLISLAFAVLLLPGCGDKGAAVSVSERSASAEAIPAARDGKWVRRMRELKRRLDEAELIFADDFDREQIGDEWIVEEGDWTTCRSAGFEQDGVVGTNGENYPDSFLWSKKSFKGDLVIEVEAECLSDPPNDINLVMYGRSPNYPPPEVPLYLFGLGGWENTKSGIERAPDYKWKMLTALFTLELNTRYRIQAARIGNKFYLFVDGRLVTEAADFDPLKASGQVALHVFNSRVQFSKLRLRKP